MIFYFIASPFETALSTSIAYPTAAPTVFSSSANGEIALICGILALVVFLIGMYVLN